MSSCSDHIVTSLWTSFLWYGALAMVMADGVVRLGKGVLSMTMADEIAKFGITFSFTHFFKVIRVNLLLVITHCFIHLVHQHASFNKAIRSAYMNNVPARWIHIICNSYSFLILSTLPQHQSGICPGLVQIGLPVRLHFLICCSYAPHHVFPSN